MSKNIVVVLMVLLALIVALSACAGPTPNIAPASELAPDEMELRYDDGKPDGRQGLGGPGYGFLVEFSPSTSFKITKVKIFGELVGSGYENRTFDVMIWEDQGEVYSSSFPHTKFSSSSGWVEIDIPGVVVSDNFSVVVITNTPREGGVYLHYDSSVKNEHSDLVQDWEVKDWYLKVPKEKVNWMVRVMGTIEK